MAGRPLVFDSWAIVAFLQDEPAAAKVESLLAEAQGSPGSLWVTAVNLGEVWYRVARLRSPAKADEAIEAVCRLGFQVEPVGWDLARQAAGLKAKGRIAYADCFAAALARTKKARVVTGDPEFRQLESEVEVYWL